LSVSSFGKGLEPLPKLLGTLRGHEIITMSRTSPGARKKRRLAFKAQSGH
jgi:hypothetical protein